MGPAAMNYVNRVNDPGKAPAGSDDDKSAAGPGSCPGSALGLLRPAVPRGACLAVRPFDNRLGQ